MQIVAELLSREVHSRSSLNEKDLFARSAINRYYYACYRVVWKMHVFVYPLQQVPGHSNLPDKIRIGLYNKIKQALRNGVVKGLINHGDAAKRRNRARINTKELSDILAVSYGVRCVADYEPDKIVVVNGKEVVLGETSLHSAANWLKRVETHCGSIQSEWKDLGN